MKKVFEKLETLSLYDLEGSLDSTLKKLQGLKESHPGKDLKLSLQNDDDDYQVLAVMWERPENEQEIKKRAEEKADAEEYRRQMYHKLKKEFES